MLPNSEYFDLDYIGNPHNPSKYTMKIRINQPCQGVLHYILNTAHVSIWCQRTTTCYAHKSSTFFCRLRCWRSVTLWFLQFRLRARCYPACDLAANSRPLSQWFLVAVTPTSCCLGIRYEGLSNMMELHWHWDVVSTLHVAYITKHVCTPPSAEHKIWQDGSFSLRSI